MVENNRRTLSKRARTVWAKSHTDPRQQFALVGWLPLHQHLADTAAIADRLWQDWTPSSLRRMLAGTFGSEASARSLLVWLAGVHDVGKASPAFAVQVPVLADDMSTVGLISDPRIKDGDERRRTRHELVSFLAVRDWLQSEHGFDRGQASRLASVAAAHHGKPAAHAEIAAAEPLTHLIGDGAWRETRRELLAHADTSFADASAIDTWRTADVTQPALVILSALVIVADWIASSDAFPSAPLGAQPEEPAEQRAARAWAQLDFPRPWQANPATDDPAALLARRFALPAGAVPHPTQIALIQQALRIGQPELMILEAEMGSGKTEAALLAAEILSARFGMSGIFVGLPTQATADGMFSRVLSWAERLDLDTPSNVFLARGKAQLNPEFAKRTRAAHFRSIGNEYSKKKDASESLVIAHRWFSDPRRGPLSNFVTGTIDQALFAGLRSRYLMLRHLALASKVVVIDEAHAYDEYMEQFLTRVLEWLGAYGVPVIMLSATLPSERRCAYVEAYDRGREALRPPEIEVDLSWAERRARREIAEDNARARYEGLAGQIGYPAVTVSDASGKPTIVTPATGRASRSVHLDRIDDDPRSLVRLVGAALRAGGNLAIVRNSVRRAQETAAALRVAFPDVPLTVAHSRFLALDRARKDRELLQWYGPHGKRPSTSIIVATQVIEQSLDVDFDLMVTDAAPADLILQRIGRLHRHRRNDRPTPLREPRLVIAGVDWAATPPRPDADSGKVYGDALLLRTLAAVDGQSSLALPDDIAPLVETVYGTDSSFVPEDWMPTLAEATRKHREEVTVRQQKARNYTLGTVRADASLIGWITGPDVDPELTPPGRGTVRDTDETLEVIVLQRGTDGILRTPTWLAEGADQQIPDNEAPGSALTRTILGCFLRLPAGMCRGNAIDRHITELERRFELPTWHSSHALKGELVLVFDPDRRARLNEFDLSYSPKEGLTYSRRSP